MTLPASTGVGAPRENSYSVSRGFTGGSGETFFVMSGLGVGNRLYHREYTYSNGKKTLKERRCPTLKTPWPVCLVEPTMHSGVTVGDYTYIVADDVDASAGRV